MSRLPRRLRPIVVLALPAVLAGCGALGGGDDTAGSGATSTVDSTAFPPPIVTTTLDVSTGQTTMPPPTTVAPGSGPTIEPPPDQTTTTAAGSPSTSAGGSGSTYTVKAGDSLYGIAQKLKVPYASLLKVNGFTDTSTILPGDAIKVPASTGSSGSGTTSTTVPSSGSTSTTVASKPSDSGKAYTVVAGDSWYAIAGKLGVKVADLLTLNGATSSTALMPGEQLKVPVKR